MSSSSNNNEALGRRHTLELWENLKELALKQQGIDANFALDETLVQGVLEHFLPSPCENLHTAYWLAHGELAGELMALLAHKLGRNEALYRQVGRLHDADYYIHPHYGDSEGLVHPAPLCKYLLELKVPAVVCLAVLEHAGYTGNGSRFSSVLSAAVSTCDDLATYMSCLKSTDFVRRHGHHVATSKLSASAQVLVNETKTKVPVFPEEFACPRRVLDDVDLFINRSLKITESGTVNMFDV